MFLTSMADITGHSKFCTITRTISNPTVQSANKIEYKNITIILTYVNHTLGHRQRSTWIWLNKS